MFKVGDRVRINPRVFTTNGCQIGTIRHVNVGYRPDGAAWVQLDRPDDGYHHGYCDPGQRGWYLSASCLERVEPTSPGSVEAYIARELHGV